MSEFDEPGTYTIIKRSKAARDPDSSESEELDSGVPSEMNQPASEIGQLRKILLGPVERDLERRFQTLEQRLRESEGGGRHERDELRSAVTNALDSIGSALNDIEEVKTSMLDHGASIAASEQTFEGLRTQLLEVAGTLQTLEARQQEERQEAAGQLEALRREQAELRAELLAEIQQQPFAQRLAALEAKLDSQEQVGELFLEVAQRMRSPAARQRSSEPAPSRGPVVASVVAPAPIERPPERAPGPPPLPSLAARISAPAGAGAALVDEDIDIAEPNGSDGLSGMVTRSNPQLIGGFPVAEVLEHSETNGDREIFKGFGKLIDSDDLPILEPTE